jgi:adenylate cyclase
MLRGFDGCWRRKRKKQAKGAWRSPANKFDSADSMGQILPAETDPPFGSLDRAKFTEQSIRLTTGLVLFVYATTHLASHSFGVISLSAMQTAGAVLIDPWRSYPGLIALYGSFLVHGGLGLCALYRRRHVRIPRAEFWQLVSGLLIPLLLVSHAATARLNGSFNGVDLDYRHLLHGFFVVAPFTVLPRQFLLLLAVWTHGCLGVRMWIRTKAWYRQLAPWLLLGALLLPTLAVVGVTAAGLGIREASNQDRLQLESFATTQKTYVNPHFVSLEQVVLGLTITYVSLLTIVLGARLGRLWYTNHFSPIRITYVGGGTAAVPGGFSVLEASRWVGFPHESVCGGRGRCSTCRVRVIDGIEALPQPSAAERSTLARIKAPFDVRLACQIRPTGSITVQPLVVPRASQDGNGHRFGAAINGGTECEVAAMFVDLRDSTKLASGRLPFDTLFLFDRYIQAVTVPVNSSFGHVTSIAGDGIMSIFGPRAGATRSPATNALIAALAIWEGLERLNIELSSELATPLRIGIGIHYGPSVVGWALEGNAPPLQFLGETGSIAAKLEEQTKHLRCTLAVTTAAISAAGLHTHDIQVINVAVPGKPDGLPVARFDNKEQVISLLARL